MCDVIAMDGSIMYLDKLPHLWHEIEGHRSLEDEENNQLDEQSPNNEIHSQVEKIKARHKKEVKIIKSFLFFITYSGMIPTIYYYTMPDILQQFEFDWFHITHNYLMTIHPKI